MAPAQARIPGAPGVQMAGTTTTTLGQVESGFTQKVLLCCIIKAFTVGDPDVLSQLLPTDVAVLDSKSI